MADVPDSDPIAQSVVSVIQTGDVERLKNILREQPDLVRARITNDRGGRRTLLHVAADWPGHFPNGGAIVSLLIEAGADPNPPTIGTPHEPPLHWAASSDDVAVLDALLDGGANIEAPGAIFTGGTAMSDAVVFAQWKAARRLLERGARTTLWQAAALGLLDRVESHFAGDPQPGGEEITNAFWYACRGGQQPIAAYLLNRGADVNWVGHGRQTPLQAAIESANHVLIAWLARQGATTGA